MKTNYITFNNEHNSRKDKGKKSIKNFNYGLAILKSFLAFLVVLSHFFNPESTKNKFVLFFATDRKFHDLAFLLCLFILCRKIFCH